jgi:hypothetical protein
MGHVSFAIFSFLTEIASHAPNFFHIPQDGSEVGLPGRDLSDQRITE